MQRILKIFFWVLFLIVCLLSFRTLWILSHTTTADFGVYYQAAQNVFHSNSLYIGKSTFTLFAYPPISAIVFIPFLLFPYLVGQTLFLVISFTSLIGIAFLISQLLFKKLSPIFIATVFSLSYLSFPTKFTLGMGQINLIAYVVLLLSFFYFQKKQHILVALLFVIACICKPILGFMLLFFILQKQWKTIGYMILFGALLFGVGLLIDHNSVNDYMYYIQQVIPEVSKPVGREIYYNQGFMGFVFREISNQTIRLIASYIGMLAIIIVGLGKVFISKKQYLFQFALLLSMVPLLDTMSWQHHFVILIFPFAFTAVAFYKNKDYFRFGVVAFSYFLVSINIARPEMFTNTVWSFFLSNTFYGSLMLFLLLVTAPQKQIALLEMNK